MLTVSWPSITDVDADFASDYGLIKAEWQCDGTKEMTYRVTVPANTTATLRLPIADGLYVYESGEVADEAEGVEYTGTADGYATFEVGSGSYLFSVSSKVPDNIGEVKSEESKVNNEETAYNLAGQKMESITRGGLYIVNGKKVLVK